MDFEIHTSPKSQCMSKADVKHTFNIKRDYVHLHTKLRFIYLLLYLFYTEKQEKKRSHSPYDFPSTCEEVSHSQQYLEIIESLISNSHP